MLKMAIPNKGRLFDQTTVILKEAGFDFDIHARRLSSRVENFGLEILFTRTDDIPVYLSNGIVDLGITGHDIVIEHGSDLELLSHLRFGKCQIVVAAPAGKYDSVKALPRDCRVATSFPNITKRYFEQHGICAEIADIHGAVEISPKLGLADAIVDITSSGTTLAMNELAILDVLLESDACLFANRSSFETHSSDIDLIVSSINSVLDAHSKKYIMANLPASQVERVKSILPSITAPTILHLAACPDTVAIHSVINEKEVNRIVKELRNIGAVGILVLNIERLFN